MGLLGDIFGLADDIVSIPTDLVGLTNHYGKKRAKKLVDTLYQNGKITAEEYLESVKYINKQ